MTFSNFSEKTFQLDLWGYQESQVAGTINQSPGKTLAGPGGSASLSQTQMLSSVGKAETIIFCVWRSDESGWRFGLRITSPVQVFMLGNAPYYEVMSDQKKAGEDPEWKRPDDDPSKPYTWPRFGSVEITATPDADHSTMSVGVVIDDSTP